MDRLQNFIKNLKQNDITQIEFYKLLEAEYLTDKNPSKVFYYEQWGYVFILFSIILSVVVFKFISFRFFDQKPKYEYLRKASFIWLVNTIFLLLHVLFRVGGVKFLSMRLFLVLILIGYLLILLYSVLWYFIKLPKRMKEFRKAKVRNRYS